MRVRVRVTPRASRGKLSGATGALRAWVTAPAEEGRANDALVDLLAKGLGVRPSEVRIVSGARSRDKLVEVPDRAGERLRALLAG